MILITGAAGYIGTTLVRQLLNLNYRVRGFDNLSFGSESINEFIKYENFEFIEGDIRDYEALLKSIEDVNAVVHFASLVGDPACLIDPNLTEETNWHASKNLFDQCQKSNQIQRFIFASTCSNYGKMEGVKYVNEDSLLNPISLYANLKVKFEKYLLESSTRSDFIPTSLRFATVYGLSPRMRFDLTINEFVREVTLGKELKVYGENFWRPYCHVEDIASACIAVLNAPKDKIDHEVFGVGDTNQNYQKKGIVREILKIIPNARIKYVTLNEDPRDYRVDFTKIRKILNFHAKKNVQGGILEIYDELREGNINNPYLPKYKNV